MATPDNHIAELIAGALAGELSQAEQREFDRLRSQHPWIDDELRDLGVVAARLRHGDLSWTTGGETDPLRSRIVAAIDAERAAATTAAPAAPPGVAELGSRRRWFTPLVAAACLVIGLGLGLGAPGLLDRTPTGPPGTLGAVEPVSVSVDASGVTLSVDVVAHTWGTEAIITATGLQVGSPYEVVFIGEDGGEFSAGEILGSQVPILCRMNAAVMRPDTVRVEVRSADAHVVAHADLPAA